MQTTLAEMTMEVRYCTFCARYDPASYFGTCPVCKGRACYNPVLCVWRYTIYYYPIVLTNL